MSVPCNMSKRLDREVKPLSLEQGCYPVNNTVNYAGGGAVDDNRAGDDEHFSSEAQNEALGFKLDGGRGDCVSKAGYRHQRSRACAGGYFIVKAETRQKRA